MAMLGGLLHAVFLFQPLRRLLTMRLRDSMRPCPAVALLRGALIAIDTGVLKPFFDLAKNGTSQRWCDQGENQLKITLLKRRR